MAKTRVIGIMSGTSLDGLDIACCDFSEENGVWNYEIVSTQTISYSDCWLKKIVGAQHLDPATFSKLNIDYGIFIGEAIHNFIRDYKIHRVQLIASHGHTIFHQPEKKLTVQIGSGAAIASVMSLPVVCDFRSLDVALGGQGAPLVPFGDKHLFSEYEYCLNLGGIANISFDQEAKRIAFDICPCNMPLNLLAEERGKKFDENGTLASEGKINSVLLDELNSLQFYRKSFPKSLGREWFESEFHPILHRNTISIEDKLRTVTEHLAIQISHVVNAEEYTANCRILVTGGGAFNSFLLSRIKALCKLQLVLPDASTINFKEAIIFAFLGLLRFQHKINTDASVTGASRDSSGGALYFPEIF